MTLLYSMFRSEFAVGRRCRRAGYSSSAVRTVAFTARAGIASARRRTGGPPVRARRRRGRADQGLEPRDHRIATSGLGVELLARRRAFLGGRGRRLRHLFHLRDRLRHLVDALRLLPLASLTSSTSRLDLVTLLGDGRDRLRRPVRPCWLPSCGRWRSTLRSAPAVSLRRLRRALRQVAHFVGDDREAHARPRRRAPLRPRRSARGCWSGTRSRRSS